MTEPDDHELEQYLAGKHRLSQRYREATQGEQSPPELDDAILGTARAATPRKRRSVRRWAVPFGLAASLMIGGPLVWQLRQAESPQSVVIYESAENFAAMREAPPEDSAQRVAAQKTERAMAPAAVPSVTPAPRAEADRGESLAAAPPPKAFSQAAPRKQGSASVMADQSAPDSPTHNFTGFGPAQFGDDEESVRIAWGRPLTESGNEPGACQRLFAEPQSAFGISFMLVGGRFARYDVTSPQFEAPGGIRVGDTRAMVESRHEGRVTVTPRKYVDGADVLTIESPQGGTSRLIFEMTPDGIVERWRIGVPPGVDYVEGCG